MYIENFTIFANEHMVLYRKSDDAFIGKSCGLTITFRDAEGNHISIPQFEDESYFYEKFDVSEIRNKKLAELNEYDNSDDVNTIVVNGVSICFRLQRRQQLRTLANVCLANGQELMNVWSDDIEYTVPAALVLKVLDQYELYASKVYDTTATYRAFLNVCDDAEELNAFNVTTGYPEPLNINIEL